MSDQERSEGIAVVGGIGRLGEQAAHRLRCRGIANLMLPAWPALRSKAIRPPAASMTAWIFVVLQPRSRPIACSRASLFRRRCSGEFCLSCCRRKTTRLGPKV